MQHSLNDLLDDGAAEALPGLGQHLFALLIEQPTWIHHKRETVTLVDEVRFHRELIADFSIRADTRELASRLDLGAVPLPLILLQHSELQFVRFELRDGNGEYVAPLTTPQHQRIVEAMAYGLFLETEGSDDATPFLEALALGSESFGLKSTTNRSEWAQLRMKSERMRRLFTILDTGSPLFIEVPVSEFDRQHRVMVACDETAASGATLPKSVRLGMQAATLLFEVPEASRCQNYSFELVPPLSLRVTSSQLRTSTGETLEASESNSEPTRVSTHSDGIPAGASKIYASVRAHTSKDGLFRAVMPCVVLALGISLTVFLFRQRLTHSPVDSPVVLLLVIPGVIAALIVRPGEHIAVSDVSRGIRRLTWASGLILFVEAGVLALRPDAHYLFYWLLVCLLVSLGCLVGLVTMWLQRSRTLPTAGDASSSPPVPGRSIHVRSMCADVVAVRAAGSGLGGARARGELV